MTATAEAPVVTTYPLAEVLEMSSLDSCNGETVREVLNTKCLHSPYYDTLREVMASGRAFAPVGVRDYLDGTTAVFEGHHRIKIALELGWTEIAASATYERVSDNGYGLGAPTCDACWTARRMQLNPERI